MTLPWSHLLDEGILKSTAFNRPHSLLFLGKNVNIKRKEVCTFRVQFLVTFPQNTAKNFSLL